MTSQTFSNQLMPPQSSTGSAARLSGDESAEISTRRQQAFKRARQHSRTVYWLRRTLPVLAVVCCFAYFFTGKFSFQFKDHKVSVEKIDVSKNELKMTNPRLEGHDKKAGSYLVTADTATQKANSPYVINLNQISGKLDHPKNGAIHLRAKTGVFNTKQEVLNLSGDLVINAPNGMQARLDRAEIIFKKQTISSDRPVYVQMESGTIRAERVFIDGATKTITFQDRVKVRLIKTPKRLNN